MSLAAIAQRDPAAARAIARTLPFEGGLADVAADPGGITNHGVSLRFALQQIKATPELILLFDVDHNGTVDRRDILGMTADQAAEIFFECWWQPGWYRKLSPELLAWKCFDIAVNTGPVRAALLLQKALVALGSNIPVDGAVGPLTLTAVQSATKADAGAALLAALRKAQAAFYRGLAAQEPDFKTFLAGWLNRAAA